MVAEKLTQKLKDLASLLENTNHYEVPQLLMDLKDLIDEY